MKVEVQGVIHEAFEDVVEITDKEIIDGVKTLDCFLDMTMEEAIREVARQKIEERYREYDDIDIDSVRIIE